MRALWRASIWAPGAIPIDERKYAVPLKRVLFPLFDVAVILLGMFGLWSGFQALQLTLPSPGPAWLYGTLAVAGLVCLAGAAFPRLWLAEIGGKAVILAALGVLLGAMLIAAREIPGHSGLAVSPLVGIAILVPCLRIWILVVEWTERKAS